VHQRQLLFFRNQLSMAVLFLSLNNLTVLVLQLNHNFLPEFLGIVELLLMISLCLSQIKLKLSLEFHQLFFPILQCLLMSFNKQFYILFIGQIFLFQIIPKLLRSISNFLFLFNLHLPILFLNVLNNIGPSSFSFLNCFYVFWLFNL
jgi:hypothetical protein